MLGRGGVGALVLLAVLLVAPPVSAAPFLQWGVDAGRTGVTDDPGPQSYDTALQVRLPGLREYDAPPIVVGDHVYVLINVSAPPELGAAETGVWRLDLATGAMDRIVDLEASGRRLSSLTSDGQRLFVGERSGFNAYWIETGAPAWAVPAPYPVGTTEPTDVHDCLGGAAFEGTLFVACTFYTHGLPGRAYAWAIDAQTGETRWTWTRGAGAERRALLPTDAAAEQPFSILGQTFALAGGTLVLSTFEADQGFPDPCAPVPMPAEVGASAGMTYLVWGLDAASGRPVWARPAPQYQGVPGRGPPLRSVTAALTPIVSPPTLTGTDDTVFLGYQGQLVAVDPMRGCGRARLSILPTDETAGPLDAPNSGEQALALAGNVLYATAFGRLVAVDVEAWRVLWQAPLPGPEPLILAGGLVRAGDTLFGIGYDGEAFGLDAASGEVTWLARFSTDTQAGPPVNDRVAEPPVAFAAGERVLVVVDGPGTLTVLGRTEASIRLVPVARDPYPEVGTEIQLDLAGSQAGAQSPETEFRVAWGDGTDDGWHVEPAFRHVYAEPGRFEALVEARNDAGQTASEVVVFNVGGTPPAVPTYWAAPFSRSHADLTFGFLGVGLTLLGAVVAVARHRRHQHALAPLGVSERTELYRAALARAVIDDGTVPAPQAAVLAELRARLGLTDRDHALLLQSVLAARRSGSGLDLRPGETVLGKYRIQRLLGSGGQGRTYVAEDTALGRPVALKILHPGTGDEQAILREARAIGSIRHPNVVTVHDVDRFGDGVFVVMEFVEGGSLKERLARGPMVTAEFRGLARDLLGALEAVHGAGTMHLDVKPGNILLTPTGQAKLADFGIAYRPGLESTAQAWRTNSGTASGTIQYMSPEQAKGRTVTTRSDLYSAAAVLYEAWTGRPYLEPVSGESAVELQMRAAAARQFDRDIDAPEELLAWFRRALEPVAADRYGAASEMLAGLDAALVEAERKVVRG